MLSIAGWTDWAEIFCEHSWVAGGCYMLKKKFSAFKKKIFSVDPLNLESQNYAKNILEFSNQNL